MVLPQAGGQLLDGAFQTVQKVDQPAQVHLARELLGCRAFQVVGLVNDQAVVFGQDLAAGGNVGKQERVIDDQQVGRTCLAVRFQVEVAETAAKKAAAGGRTCEGAPFQAAFVCMGGDVRHQGLLSPVVDGKLAQVTGLGVRQPDQQFGQKAQLQGRQGAGEEASAAARRIQPGGQPARTQVTGTAFQGHCPNFAAAAAVHVKVQRGQGPGHAGQLLFQQLVLQRQCMGGDYDTALIADGPGCGRQEIGQALARAGARFDDPVIAPVERVQGLKRHLQLAVAPLELCAGTGIELRRERPAV